MALRSVALAVVLTAVGLSEANAIPNHGWYASAELGADWSSVAGIVTDLPLGGLLALDTDPALGSHPTIGLDTGWGGFATVGFILGPHINLEAELGYRTAAATGNETLSQKTLMINGLFIWPVLEKVSLSAGAGLGADLINWDDLGSGPSHGGDQTLFAYQGIVGLTYDLTDRMGFVARYRYLATTGADMHGFEAPLNSPRTFLMHGDDAASQTLTIGLQFAL